MLRERLHGYAMNSPKTLVAALFTALALSGCATIFTGTYDDIRIESTPPGAQIRIDGFDQAKTPATITVHRDALRNKTVTLHKDGYEDRSFRLQREFNLVSVCNWGVPIFWMIDVLSGSLFLYDPLYYNLTLEPKGDSVQAVPDVNRRAAEPALAAKRRG